jgi:hypothetical protein
LHPAREKKFVEKSGKVEKEIKSKIISKKACQIKNNNYFCTR